MMAKTYLRASILFQGVDDQGLQPLLPICQEVTVEKDARIFTEGDPAQKLYIVGQGRVALQMTLERPDGSTTDPTTVASIGPGDTFGWSALVEPHVLTLSATAVERSHLIFFEGRALREALARHRDVGYTVMVNVARLLGERLNQTREALVYERGWLFRQPGTQ